MSLTGKFDAHNRRKVGKVGDQSKDVSFDRYASPGHARNLCFVQPDGKRLFLNYAYLISGEYQPEDNSVLLTFTTHRILLKGESLEILYESLLFHTPKIIYVIEKRYASCTDEKAVVHNIQIMPMK